MTTPNALTAVRTGDELQVLYALRSLLAEAMESCSARDLAALTIRMRQVVTEISSIEDERSRQDPLAEAMRIPAEPLTPEDPGSHYPEEGHR